MRNLKTVTYILATLFLGLIIGGAIDDNRAAWISGLVLLIIDIIIGISIQYHIEQHNTKPNASSHSKTTNTVLANTPQLKSFLPKGRYRLSEFLKEEALTPRLMDTVVSIGESGTSRYDKDTNTIYVNVKDNSTQNSFLNILSRCYQQAYCYDVGILYSSTPIGMNDPLAKQIDKYLSNDFSYDDEDTVDSFGKVINEKTFAENQKRVSGFFPDYSYNKEKYVALKKQKENSDNLTAIEESRLIFPLIFGNFECEINLDKALSETKKLLNRILNEKPKEELVRDNNAHMLWLHDHAIAQILLGTIFAYQQEYIKSAYHFMLGLKTHQLTINMPYSDFIRYILGKLHSYVKESATFEGCGFSAENPMGSCGGNTLIANNAMQIIPEMEGQNGEVIVARMGRKGILGHLRRVGSTFNENSFEMIDIYETYLIDSSYNIKKIRFFFNSYFDLGNERIKIASGFKLNSHSTLFDFFDVVED